MEENWKFTNAAGDCSGRGLTREAARSIAQAQANATRQKFFIARLGDEGAAIEMYPVNPEKRP